MTDSYTVTRHEHGIVVTGIVPLQDICALMGAWQEAGYTLCDALIANHLGVNSVYTTEAGSREWRRELGLEGDQ